MERPYTSASNMARLISKQRSSAKAKWEADKCSKHFGYRLKGKAGAKRSIQMTSVKSLATRFYKQKSAHAPTGVYLERFSHREDNKCWWCGGGGGRTAALTREHLFHHGSGWRDQQNTLWKGVGMATGWKASRCHTYRSLSWFPETSEFKRWWTSWWLLKLGSSRPNEWRKESGKEADSSAGSGSSRHISFLIVSFSFSFLLFWSFFELSFVIGDEG